MGTPPQLALNLQICTEKGNRLTEKVALSSPSEALPANG